MRFTEPDLPRPFKVPGGIFGVVLTGTLPMLLLAFAIVRSNREQILAMNSFLFGALVILAGLVAYSFDKFLAKRLR